jgi:DNA modification methylase
MTATIINTKTTKVPVDLLVEHPQNPRVGNVDVIVESIESSGFYGVIVVQASTNYVLAGNHRLKAARKVGMQKVPVMWVDVDDERALRILLADNRTSDMATSDNEKLAGILKELLVTDAGFDGTGYVAHDLDDIMKQLEAAAAVESGTGDGDDDDDLIDEADALLDTWGVKSGDVWTAGGHTIIVGDSTDAETWAKVPVKVDALVTSPPYAQQRAYTKEISDWESLMDGVFGHAAAAMVDNGQMLVNLGMLHKERRVWRYWDPWLESMDDSGWPLFGWYVWDQGPGMPGDYHGRFTPSHEFVFHMAHTNRDVNKTVACKHAGDIKTGSGTRGKDGVVDKWSHEGQATQDTRVGDTVLRVTRQKGPIEAGDHPAVFPVRLPAALIDAFTQPGEVVLDPFMGSGSTLLAAHAADRVGIGIEFAPKYAAVALERLRLAGLELKRHRQ